MTPLIVTATLTVLAAVTLPVRRLRHVGGISTRDLTVLAVAVVLYTVGIELEIIPIIVIGAATLIAGCVSAATPPRGDQLDPVDQLLATAPALPDLDTDDELDNAAPDDDRVVQLLRTVEELSDRLVALGGIVEDTDELLAGQIRDIQRRLGAA